MKRLTVPEVAEQLRCSERFVLDEIRRKNLRASKIGGAWKLTPEDVERYENAKANVPAVRRRSA